MFRNKRNKHCMLGDPVSVSKEVSKKAEECSVRVQ